jgi:hypothetical protein
VGDWRSLLFGGGIIKNGTFKKIRNLGQRQLVSKQNSIPQYVP